MGRESVRSYPRPPALAAVPERVRVVVAGVTIADTRRAIRVLETSHPPTYYVPPEDVRMDLLVPARGSSVCEWKGRAGYHALAMPGEPAQVVAWSYPGPSAAYRAIAGYLAFYADRVDEAWVGDERAHGQAGGFYGGWITSGIEGPFKGEPGTSGW